jgi:hypothetical protein
MQYTILLNRTDDIKKFEAQEQSRFIYTILEALSIPVEWDNPDEPLTIEQKIKFRKTCSDYSITVVDDNDGGIKIYDSNGTVGEWYKCKYKVKEDRSQRDPQKKLYMEAYVSFWAKFEKEEDAE